jgi:hypothetical protein
MDISEDRVMLHLVSKSRVSLCSQFVLYASSVINDVTNTTVSQELFFLSKQEQHGKCGLISGGVQFGVDYSHSLKDKRIPSQEGAQTWQAFTNTTSIIHITSPPPKKKTKEASFPTNQSYTHRVSLQSHVLRYAYLLLRCCIPSDSCRERFDAFDTFILIPSKETYFSITTVHIVEVSSTFLSQLFGAALQCRISLVAPVATSC